MRLTFRKSDINLAEFFIAGELRQGESLPATCGHVLDYVWGVWSD